MFKELKKYFDICPNIPPNSLSNKYADDIYDSMDGMGTDEDKIIKTFQQFKTFNEFCATKKSYVNIYKSEMIVDIFDDNTKWDITIDQGDYVYKTLNRILRNLYDVAAAARKQTTGGGAQRLMKEDKDNKKMDLKSDFKDIIDHKYYSEIEPSDLVEVLEELLHYAKNDVFRSKKPNKGYITKDEVIKNFKKNYN